MKRPRRIAWTPDMDEVVRTCTIPEAARRLGVSEGAVNDRRRALRATGRAPRTSGASGRPKGRLSAAGPRAGVLEILRLHAIDWPPYEIARIRGISKQAVHDALRKYVGERRWCARCLRPRPGASHCPACGFKISMPARR